MDVVGYMHHADILLEDEQGVAIIGGGNYVLSIGDRVYFKREEEHSPERCTVDISFAGSGHIHLLQDVWAVKFTGTRTQLHQYLMQTTVH